MPFVCLFTYTLIQPVHVPARGERVPEAHIQHVPGPARQLHAQYLSHREPGRRGVGGNRRLPGRHLSH